VTKVILIEFFELTSSGLTSLGWVDGFETPTSSEANVYVRSDDKHYKLSAWGDESGISMAIGEPTAGDVVVELADVSDDFLLEKAQGAEREALCALLLLTSKLSMPGVIEVFIKALRNENHIVAAYAETVLTSVYDDRVQLALARLELRREHNRNKGRK
jgi:hypothetical protein